LGIFAPFGSTSGGMRYDNVPIPNGAKIDSAIVTCTSTFPQAFVGAVEVDIFLEQEDDPGDFAAPCTMWQRQLDAKAAGAVLTNWVTDYTDWTNLAEVDTPDFKAGVQQKTDDAGWVSGAAMVIFMADDGDSARRLTVSSFERDGLGPLFTVDYHLPPEGNPALSGTAYARGDARALAGVGADEPLPASGQADMPGLPRGGADLVGAPRGGAGTVTAIPPPGSGRQD
ncbi:hypothetical protein LCGC14_1464300, partial [marine sediment metagenome]